MSFLKKGNSEFLKENYKEAEALYKKAKESEPNLTKFVDFNLALCERRLTPAAKTTSALVPMTAGPIKAAPEVRKTEYYPKEHPAAPYLMSYQVYSVDIVIPVYNALDDVKLCLKSVAEKNRGLYLGDTYIVNDGSDRETTDYLRWFCAENEGFHLIEHEKNCGYTKTVNDGLRASTADFVITLNSDTIVTKGWLQGLVRCIRSDDRIGIVGPLSNAASWQNVPVLLDENNQFAVNELPQGFAPDDMAEVVLRSSHHVYPKVPFVNGFCFMMAREVIDKVGLLDEERFPTGYGEENDYCIRATDAGFELAIADDTYVFHAKSKSFGHETRKVYSKNGSETLKAKHGKDLVNELAGNIRDMTQFEDIRFRVSEGLTKGHHSAPKGDPLSKRIMFLLPVSGGGGGVHSIVQETMGMRRLGVTAKIAVPAKHRHKFLKVYEDIAEREELFLGFDNTNIDELVKLSQNFDVIVGTIYTSMKMIKSVKEVNKNITMAYYVQDYEPLFDEPGSEAWKEAYASYTLVPDTILFAKTDWICEKVFDMHGVQVRKVSPSIDHDVYKPKAGNFDKDHIVISTMIRPKTPRRGADRTMRILKRLYDRLGPQIRIELFGCERDDPLFRNLERSFKYTLHGVLTRNGVANVLQSSDIFMDLSDYQAFGRTGLEAMACGALSVVTQYGGVYEYIKNENGLVVDVFDENSTFDKVLALVEKGDIPSVKVGGMMMAANFSINKAAISEILKLGQQ